MPGLPGPFGLSWTLEVSDRFGESAERQVPSASIVRLDRVEEDTIGLSTAYLRGGIRQAGVLGERLDAAAAGGAGRLY